MRRKRDTRSNSPTGITEYDYTDSPHLDIASDHTFKRSSKRTNTSRPGRQRQRTHTSHPQRGHQSVLGPTEASLQQAADNPAARDAPMPFIQSAGPNAQLGSPANSDIMPCHSPDMYQHYVASLRLDLDNCCVIVATDSKEAKCVAVAAFQASATALGLQVSTL